MSTSNLELLETVVGEIGDLRDEVVFVGGSIVELLLTIEAPEEVRATDDVDCIIEVTSSLAYQEVERRLLARGWALGSQSVEGDPLCRFRMRDLVLDVMPTDGSILGFSNRWADEAMSHSASHDVGGATIKVVSAPYFVAMKIEAFESRGGRDYMSSKDLEDLVVLIDGRPEIVEETKAVASPELRTYLTERLRAMMPRVVTETLPGVLRDKRGQMAAVERRLRDIVGGAAS